ncbi:unnamed protein product [Prorocentrum cordatum]|uniref:Uncharacterized protein n=1 Tax=Prorocentrum cordatum TaxID=2364126 RepID=A0ABN9X9I6_9DINO|nr:unnamed protein product [Polarella glacialis]
MAAAEAAAGSPSAAGTGRLGGRCGSPSSASMCSGGERRSFDRGLSGSSSRGGERDGGGCRRAGSCGWEPPCDEQQEEAQIRAGQRRGGRGGRAAPRAGGGQRRHGLAHGIQLGRPVLHRGLSLTRALLPETEKRDRETETETVTVTQLEQIAMPDVWVDSPFPFPRRLRCSSLTSSWPSIRPQCQQQGSDGIREGICPPPSPGPMAV